MVTTVTGREVGQGNTRTTWVKERRVGTGLGLRSLEAVKTVEGLSKKHVVKR